MILFRDDLDLLLSNNLSIQEVEFDAKFVYKLDDLSDLEPSDDDIASVDDPEVDSDELEDSDDDTDEEDDEDKEDVEEPEVVLSDQIIPTAFRKPNQPVEFRTDRVLMMMEW